MIFGKFVLVLIAGFSVGCFAEDKMINVREPDGLSLRTMRFPVMNTNIGLTGLRSNDNKNNNLVIDANGIAARASIANSALDIEEDADDPFITTGSGKPRPVFTQGRDSDQWSNDFLPSQVKPLSRVKRCNNNNNGANRSRANASRARKTQSTRKAKKSKKTTVTRKVIKNGQVISEETTQQAAGTRAAAPVVVTATAPVQATPVAVSAPAPVPVVAAPAPAQVVAAPAAPAQVIHAPAAPVRVIAAPAAPATANVVQNVQASSAVSASNSVSAPGVNVQQSVQVN